MNNGQAEIIKYPGGESKFAAGSREGGQAVPDNPFVWGRTKGVLPELLILK